MEPLSLPSSGAVYLDASGFIYSAERIEPYRELLAPMWRQAQAGRFTIVSSELVVLETLVKPLRDGDATAEALFRELFDAQEVRLVPATRPLWEAAARMRATTGLRTPDALHAATALHAECALFITNDSDFRRVADLPTVVMDDLVAAES
ncbi:MAG: type II toxin-antitoxin system VapC family toxin [Chloroflexota bacterium]|nr:type II toxin-antitoxin system VapC family toxin [Chloroflexota bacterium]